VAAGVPSIGAVQPVDISTWIEAHASSRTIQLYDRGRDEVSLDEVERIVI
jgi:hypothetical protein